MDPFLAIALVIVFTVLVHSVFWSSRQPPQSPQHPYQSYQHPSYPPYGNEETSYFQQPFFVFTTPPHTATPPRNDSNFSFILMASIATLLALAYVAKVKENGRFLQNYGNDAQVIPFRMDTPTIKTVQLPIENSMVLPKPMPIQGMETDLHPVQYNSEEKLQTAPYWIVYLKAYPTREAAERLRNAFHKRPIGIALRPDSTFLAYIHYDDQEQCRVCARDLNQHLPDLRPFGIYTAREVVDIAPVVMEDDEY
jgi:hypothetical protein